MKNRPLTRLWFLPLLLSMWLPVVVQALDMEDVVRLHASGYTDDQINEFLSATQSEFMLSARDVVYLSQSGVSDALVQGMLVALPLQPVNGDATLEAEPVRLLFSEEDLQLLAENQISDPVVVTFIETRDMAFTLDTDRLGALRRYGLGLDPLQVLVEKNAANVSVPLAPPAPEVMAGTGYAPQYFYGRSGNAQSFYDAPFTTTYYGAPSLYIESRTFHPWYGYEFEPRYGYGPGYGYGYGSGYGYDSGFGFGYGYGFAPHYASYYPYQWSGFYGHSFHCPRGRHHHGGGHHGRDDHDGWDRDRDHDWDRDDDRDGNFVAGPGRGKPGGSKPVLVAGDKPVVGKPGGAKPVFVAGSDPVVTRPAGGKPIVSKPAAVKPGKGTGIYSGSTTGNRTVATIWGNGTKPASGSTRIPGAQSNSADPFYGTGIKRAGTKSEPAAGHINGGKPNRPVTAGSNRSTGTSVVVDRNPGAAGSGNKVSGSYGAGPRSPAAAATGFNSPGGNVAAVRPSPVNSTAVPAVPRSGVAPRVAAAPTSSGDGRSTRGGGFDRDEGTGGRARGFKAGTSSNSVAYQGRRSKSQ